MSFVDEYQGFCSFVLEHDVRHSRLPVLYDREAGVYVAHHSHLPDRHFEQLEMPVILVHNEAYVFVKKVGGFRPEVVEK